MVDLSLVKPQDLWYTIGLITTDGNLSIDRRHINITSKDKNLLEKIRIALGLNLKIGRKARAAEKIKNYFFLQIGDIKFYKFLLSIGLKPKKSLLLETIKVPPSYFIDFIRGVIDGDGNISTWIHKSNGNRQWSLRVFSASPIFTNWLKSNLEKIFKVKGKLYCFEQKNKNPLYTIKFGKFAAKTILSYCYYRGALALVRKNEKSIKCLKSEDRLSKYGVHVPGWRNWQTLQT